MSDSDSDSSGDNNNDFPIASVFHVFRSGQVMRPSEFHLEISSSESEDGFSETDLFPQFIDFQNRFNESEVVSNNTLEDSNGSSSNQSSSSSSAFLPYIEGINGTKANIAVPKSNNWSIPKELYKREIGFYNKHAKWNNSFYQSTVAVLKLKLSKQLKGHKGCVNSLDFNTTGNLITSGSDDCKICLWDWSKGKCLLTFKSGHSRNVFQTKFLTGDKSIVSSARDGLVILSVMNESNVIYNKPLACHDGSCNKLGVHRETPFVVLSCGDDGKVKSIDIRESPIEENTTVSNILNVRSEYGPNLSILGIDINPMKPNEFIVNCNDEYVRLYDKRQLTGTPVITFKRLHPDVPGRDSEENSFFSLNCGQSSQITSAVYNYDGTEILASYSDDDIYLFDANGSNHSVLHHYSGHLNKLTVKGVNFYGPRSEYVMSGSDCQYIYIWDKNTEAIVLRKHADSKGAINVLEGHPHMPTLATSGLDDTIKIWEPLNKCQQPNKKKLRMSILNNRVAKMRRDPSQQSGRNIFNYAD